MTKYDPKYVRVIAQYFYIDEKGDWIYEDIPMRTCSDEAWAKFHPPDQGTQNYLDYIKGLNPDQTQDKDAFLCMDMNNDNSYLKPNYYSGMTVAYIPCDKVGEYELTGGSYEVDEECIADKEAQ